MGQAYSQVLESLRPHTLGRLVEVRGTIDSALNSMPAEAVRDQFEAVLTAMASYLRDRDANKFRNFVNRWAAVRTSEGYPSESMVHLVVAVGDVLIQVAKQRLGPGPETQAFATEVVRMSLMAARQVGQILSEELERRMSERRELDDWSEP